MTKELLLLLQNPCFCKQNCEKLHLFANVRLDTGGVEGLLPKFRAFLTNLHAHYINDISANCII